MELDEARLVAQQLHKVGMAGTRRPPVVVCVRIRREDDSLRVGVRFSVPLVFVRFHREGAALLNGLNFLLGADVQRISGKVAAEQQHMIDALLARVAQEKNVLHLLLF